MSVSQSIKLHPKAKNLNVPENSGELLQKYRLQTGLTQTQLAQAIGLKSLRMIQYWEAGNSLPKADNLKKLIEVFAAHHIFTPGQVREEIFKLWAVIKDVFEHTGTANNNILYPDIPTDWLSGLARQDAAAPPPPQSPVTAPQVVPFTPKAIPGNLPASLNRFVGRKKELEQISQTLRETQTRLLTLVGPGGTGKTRLSLEVARQLRETAPWQYPDGIWLVELAANSDPQLVSQLIARTLWPDGQSSGAALTMLLNNLGSKRLLIILDNCEHLIEACATVIDAVLTCCPNLQILTTSREPLKLAGETCRTLGGLALPGLPKSGQSHEGQVAEAVELFVTRVKALEPDFELNETNRVGLSQLCHLLDGLPLALQQFAKLLTQ